MKELISGMYYRATWKGKVLIVKAITDSEIAIPLGEIVPRNHCTFIDYDNPISPEPNPLVKELVWHKYPDEKPEKEGVYLVTHSNNRLAKTEDYVAIGGLTGFRNTSYVNFWAEIQLPEGI